MHVLIVLCHPERASFNGTLVDAGADFYSQRGDTVEISDLYGEDFDPVERRENYSDPANSEIFAPLAEQRHAFKAGSLCAEVQREISRLERADLVLFQFPIWWHAMPAMMKGWFDRIFVSGGLYTSKMRYDQGYFRGKRALCSVTSGAPEASFVAGGRGGEIDQILWSTNYSLHYMGFTVFRPHSSFGIQGHGYSYVNEEDFLSHIDGARAGFLGRLANLDDEKPLHFPGWKDWDSNGRPLKTAP